MRKSQYGLIARAGIAFLASALIPLFAISPAKAVTYGTDISDPATDAPYVVSIWTSADNDARNAEFMCSGSLIAPRIVLTAAHCTMETTPYFVKVKAPTLNSNVEFVTVSGVWRSPRYNPKTFVNDIGLLKLDESFEGMPFPSLANAQTAKSINKFSRLRIFGWGLDQELEQTDFLRTADLLLQDASAAKTFGKTFNLKTMIAAGKKIVAENVWSGGCRGDSGGPLISNINGIDVVVGITSWGSAKCLPNKPTVFNRVSYYVNEIKAGIKAVESSSININRSAPVATTNPSISGDAIPGQTLKCNPGSWKNALTVQASWTSPARLIGSSNLSVQVLPTDGGSEFKCEVIASSQSASVRRVIQKFVLGKSTLRTNPVIAGITSGATFKNGQVARCEGWNWTNPVDSERVTWFTASSNNPSTPVNGRMIGTGATLSFTPEILKNEKGRYLICQVTGVKDGFESHFATAQYISTPSAPILSSVSISYYTLNDGSSVSCSYTKPYDADEVKVEWGSFTGNYFSAIPWLSGDRVSINKAVIQSAAGKSFACRVTASNLGGESTRTSYTQETFETLPNVPTVSISLSSSNPISGSYANCYATNTGSYSNTVTYQWGLTRTTGTNFFEGSVLGTSSTLYFNSANLTLLSGAFLTCVVTVTNGAGFVQGNSSSTIPLQSIVLPTPSAPSVVSQTASNTSVTVTMSIPQILNFNSSTMQTKLTITGSSNCIDRSVDPGMTYDCSGLSGNTTYSTFLSVVAKSGNGTPTRSSTSSFTTNGLSGQPVYVCGQSCTGSLSQSAMLSYLDDKRLVEAGAKPGGPITSSTCIGSGCNSGTAPALPISCGTGSSERTSLVANVSAQITTTFRYCTPPLDTTAPTIVDASASYTGNAKIIPTSGVAGTNIAVRFIAKDAIGVNSTSARLVNPSGVVVNTATGVFQVGSVTDGAYLASIATASSGPLSGDVYQIQVQAVDASGNSSGWFNLGTYTISGPLSALVPTFGPVTSNATGFTFQISNYSSNYSWAASVSAPSQPGAGATISGTGLVTVNGMSSGSSATITISNTRTGYNPGSSSIAGSSTALLSALVPTFGPVTSNATGFTFQISNYSSNYSWAASVGAPSQPGAGATISGTGLVTVNGMSSGSSATITISNTRTGYNPGSSSIAGSSLAGLAVNTISGGIPTGPIQVGPDLLINFNATDGLGITNAWIQIKNSAGTVIATYAATLISGNNLNGTYRATVNTVYSSAGTYTVEAKVGGNGRIMWDWQVLGTFVFIDNRTPADTQAPITDLGNVSATPTSLYENGSVSINVPVSDNVGVNAVSVTIKLNSQTLSSGGQGLSSGTLNLTRVSGTAVSGNWSGSTSMNLRQGASDGYLLPGIYDLIITSSDSAGNSSTVTKNAAFILGSQAGSAIIASANAVPSSGTLSAGGTVQISARVVAYNQTISAVRFSSDGYNFNKSGVLVESSGNSYDKNFTGSFIVNANQASGTYTINLVVETSNGRSSGTYPITLTVN